jgi:hypothetical protein
MVRIRRPPTANQAWLFDDVSDVAAVTDPTRFRKDQNALISARWFIGNSTSTQPLRGGLAFAV